jgi:hypothetical protein
MRRTWIGIPFRDALSYFDAAPDDPGGDPPAFGPLSGAPADNLGARDALSGPVTTTAAAAPDASPGSATALVQGAVSGSPLQIVDIIPVSDSAESGQNSEPSLAVNPLNPAQIIAGAFSNNTTPFFISLDGGATWADYDSLNTQDKTLAWAQDGSAALTSTLLNGVIRTYSGTTSGSFGAPINTFNPSHDLDQPWIRTGPSNHVYVGYNDLSAASGKTASVLVSTNGGSTYTPVTLDRVGGAVGQDAPSIRLAVNGNTAYAVFTRWNSLLDTDSSGDERFTSQVVVVRSDTGGADGFTALGANGNGVQVATPTSWFSNSDNGPLTLGQERTGGDVAIAVDPNNASHVVVAYGNAPGATGSGQMQLSVAESTDGGAHWQTKFTTSSSTRSALPALAITQNGTIGLLYDNYDPATDRMSQHLLTTGDDFLTTTDTTLASESNATPVAVFDPYVGDFYDMTSVGNTFYGIFSASNADNGSNAQFTNVTFQRHFIGTPGTASFQLTDANGHNVAPSIDPFFFSYQVAPAPVGVVGDFNADAHSDLLWQASNGHPTEWLMNGTTVTTSQGLVNPGPSWHVIASGDFNGDLNSDILWQNTDGAPAIWEFNGTAIIGGGVLVNPGPSWHAIATGDFNADGKSDILWQNTDGAPAIWELNGTAVIGGGVLINPGPSWHAIATGDFNADGKSDIVWQNADGAPAIWEMNGITVIGGGVLINPGPSWHIVATADFNADGKSDFIWQNNDGTPAIWEMNGTSVIGGGLLPNPGAYWKLIGAGNFDPVHPDLVFLHTTDEQVQVWVMNGTNVSSMQNIAVPAPSTAQPEASAAATSLSASAVLYEPDASSGSANGGSGVFAPTGTEATKPLFVGT